VAIRDQLKAVGIDATLTKFTDINTTVATSAFDATMYSFPTVPYADVAYTIGALYTPSGVNKERYSNPRVNDLFKRYGETVDAVQRAELLRQLQELVGQDVPVVYVLNPNQIVAMAGRVKDYTPHPLENYKITADTSLQ
jgi:peptide/nickel transport system substrate-binding protein